MSRKDNNYGILSHNKDKRKTSPGELPLSKTPKRTRQAYNPPLSVTREVNTVYAKAKNQDRHIDMPESVCHII
jgi:hypothetical protein